VAQHPISHGHWQARVDLERAIARVPTSTWHEATRLAAELGAEPALSAGLRQVAGGEELADSLGVLDADSAEVSLYVGDAPPEVVGLAEIAAAGSAGLRLRLILRAIAPPPTLMRKWSPAAARGQAGLVLAYVTRWARIARWAPAGLSQLRRLRGAERGSARG
jgi:hypothetical protein